MNSYCTIYLVRHGETEWNVSGLMQGQSDSPLTPEGIKQAKDLAQTFKNIKFAAVYSSDLYRAHHTAKLIALEHQLVTTTTKLLRERYLGRLEGKLWADLSTKFKRTMDNRDRLSTKERLRFRFYPEIESDEDIVIRLITFLREAAVAHLNQKILVVSHGGSMRALLIHLGFATYQELPGGSVTNTAYVVLRSDGTDFFIDQTVGITKT